MKGILKFTEYFYSSVEPEETVTSTASTSGPPTGQPPFPPTQEDPTLNEDSFSNNNHNNSAAGMATNAMSSFIFLDKKEIGLF